MNIALLPVAAMSREKSWRDTLAAEYEITQARLRRWIGENDESEEYV